MASNLLPIFISILVIIISIVFFFVWRKKSPKKTDLLVTGPCDSGKTLLFCQLLFSEHNDTFTSVKENVGDFTDEELNTPIRVVDIPGHERLRQRYFDQYKYTAKGIVFVVDSVTVQKEIRDVADYLYTVLADKATAHTPVLILCNKQDESFSKSSKIIQNLLEKELNLVRDSRQKQLQSGDEDVQFIGKPSADFEFGHLTQNVSIAECSAKDKQLTSVTKWIKSII